MSIRLIVIASLFVLNSCSKSAKDKDQLLSYESPIQFKYKPIEDKEQAAMVSGSAVSWSQLLSQDVALQELQEKYNRKILATAYAWGKTIAGETKGPITVEVFSLKPEKEIPDILKEENIEPSKDVEVTFQNVEGYDVLAKAGDKKITWDDFIGANIVHAKLYQSMFNQRMQRLKGIVVRRYLLDASKAANMPMEDFVKANIMKTEFNPTVDDVHKFAKERGISETDLDEKMVERLMDIVKQNDRDQKIEEYVAKNLIKEPIVVAYKGAKIKVATPELKEDIPQWGTKGPDVVYIGHWICDDCADSIKTFLKTKKEAVDSSRGGFIFAFPDRDREARMAAEAAFCVQSQNKDAFWTFVDKVVDVKEENLEERINIAAQGSGIDFPKFRECFLTRGFQQTVDSHLNYAKDMGITKTPLMVVQGQVLEAPFDTAEVAATLKSVGVHMGGSSIWRKIKSLFGF